MFHGTRDIDEICQKFYRVQPGTGRRHPGNRDGARFAGRVRKPRRFRRVNGVSSWNSPFLPQGIVRRGCAACVANLANPNSACFSLAIGEALLLTAGMRNPALSSLAFFIACVAVSCGKPDAPSAPPKANAPADSGIQITGGGTSPLSGQVTYDNATGTAVIKPPANNSGIILGSGSDNVTLTLGSGTAMDTPSPAPALPQPNVISPGLPASEPIKSF